MYIGENTMDIIAETIIKSSKMFYEIKGWAGSGAPFGDTSLAQQ